MRAFNDCSRVLVMDVYAAGEKPIDGIDGASLARDLKHHGHKGVMHTPTHADVLAAVAVEARKADLVITLGAGDITRLSHSILDELATVSPPTLEFD